MSTIISEFIFSPSELERFGELPGDPFRVSKNLGLNISVSSEFSPAFIADGHTVIGVIVGKFEGNGTGPAILASEPSVLSRK